MLKLKFYIFLLLMAGGLFLSAQNSLDIQRYSGYSVVGTARTMGLGGAASALGGDFGSVSLNPANIAFYQRSEITFTTGFRNFNTQSYHIGEPASAGISNFGFSNFHFVFSDNKLSDNNTLKGWAFGIGFNQLDNYYRRTEASAFNKFNSIGDYYVYQAGNYSLNYLDTLSLPYLAWASYYIDTTNGSDNEWTPVVQGNIQQNYSRKETGRMNSWEFSLGFNIQDKLYVGGALGVVDLQYTSSEIFKETDTQHLYDSIAINLDRIDVSSFEQRYNFSTTGIGINGKIGFIFRPTDAFRIGLGLQTPTSFNLKDSYQVGMTTTSDIGETYPVESPDGTYQYRLRTPFRATLGAVAVFQKAGLLSVDVDYLDYTQASLSDNLSSTTFTAANKAVSQLGNATGINFRVGGELRNNEYYARAGYANFASFWNAQGDQYDDLSSYEAQSGSFKVRDFHSTRHTFTLGGGYRVKEFYLDLTLLYQLDYLKYNLYEMPVNAASLGKGVSPVITQKRNQIGMILTFGFRF